MSDFLDNLLARNLGHADGQLSSKKMPWVRPRTRSLFESAPDGLGDVAAQNIDDESNQADTSTHRDDQTRRPTEDVQISPKVVAFDSAKPATNSSHAGTRNNRFERDNKAATVRSQPRTSELAPEHLESTPMSRTVSIFDSANTHAPDSNVRSALKHVDHTSAVDARLQSMATQLRDLAQRSEHELRPSHQIQGDGPTMQSTKHVMTRANPQSDTQAFNAVTPAEVDLALRAQLQAHAQQSHGGASAHERMSGGGHGNDSGQRAPSIQISIGRIEIRASTASASVSPAQRKDKPGPQAIGLDEYLRQRARGGRE